MITHEHKRTPPRASNALARSLARAGRALAVQGHEALETILRLAVHATRMERAFLAHARRGSPGSEPEILACIRVDVALETQPSRQGLLRALVSPRAWVARSSTTGDAPWDSASVKSLGLQTVIGAPLPGAAEARALLLDSREPATWPAGELLDRTEAFAALLALCLRLAPERRAPGPTGRQARLVADGRRMRALLERAARVARWDLPLLILGETGAGKERLARWIHQASPRAAGPFVPLNCAALPETLVESELFGAVRGAYTGLERDRAGLVHAAAGGTLFLDEVAELSPAAQAKLLRVLQEGCVRALGADRETPVDVRILAATHRALPRMVQEGRFREDLYHRLAVVVLHVPPLRERLEELPQLVRELTADLAARQALAEPVWGSDALAVLMAHSWPGNVRELESVIARSLVEAEGQPIRADHVRAALAAGLPPALEGSGPLERVMIEQALREADGVLYHAARRIGWSRQKLARRMQALGVRLPPRRRTPQPG